MILSLTQTQALDYLEDDLVNEVLFGGGAGGGKTALGCYWLLKNCLKYPGTRWLMGRSSLKTLRETTLVSFFDVAKRQGVENTFKYIAPTTIRFENGSEILLKDLYQYPSDPDFDELGSLELTGAFIDEANQITQKAKNVVRSRIRYKLIEYGLIPKMLMTCNPAKNWVKSDFRDPSIAGKLVATKKFIESLLDDNTEFAGRELYRDNLMQLDRASIERLLLANWDYTNDPSSLMTLDAIESIFLNEHVKPTGRKYITIDVARLGKDKTVARVWDGWKVIERREWSKQRINVTANCIRLLMQKHTIPTFRVLADEDGVGGGLVDLLNCKGFVANSTPLQFNPKNINYDMLKTQCAYKLAEVVNEGQVFEQPETEEIRNRLREELEYIKSRNMDKDGKRQLLQKEHIKVALGRSPDESDTYIMRAWFDLQSAVSSVKVVSSPGPNPSLSNRRSDFNP